MPSGQEVASLYATIGLVDDMSSGLNKVIGGMDAAEGKANALSSAVGKIGGLLKGLEFGGIFTKFINDASESQQAMAKLAQVVKSTAKMDALATTEKGKWITVTRGAGGATDENRAKLTKLTAQIQDYNYNLSKGHHISEVSKLKFQENTAAAAALEKQLSGTGEKVRVFIDPNKGLVPRSTLQELTDLASGLQRVTRFSDETIVETETMLMTFTKIGKTVMPQAVEAVLDLATVMGGDTKSASIQLGKALNDPIEGITALRRVGITFSKDQENMIRKLMKTNNILGAQKIILAEVNTEFGGQARAAANTFAGQLDVLNNKLSDFGEQIGNAVLPTLTIMVKALGSLFDSIGTIPPAFGVMINAGLAFMAMATPLGGIIGGIATPIVVLGGAVLGFKKIWDENFLGIKFSVIDAVNTIAPKLQFLADIFGQITGAFGGDQPTGYKPPKTWTEEVPMVDPKTGKAVIDRKTGKQKTKTHVWGAERIGGDLKADETEPKTLGKRLLDAINAAIPMIQSAVPKLASELLAWFSSAVNTFMTQAPALFDKALKSAFTLASAVGDWLVANLPAIGATIGSWFNTAIGWLATDGARVLGDLLGSAFSLGEDVLGWLAKHAPDIGTAIGTWFSGALNWLITKGPEAFANALVGIFNVKPKTINMGVSAKGGVVQMKQFTSIADDIAKGIGDIFEGALTLIGGIVVGLFGPDSPLGDTIRDFFTGDKGAVQTAWRDFQKWWQDAFGEKGTIATAFTNFVDSIGTAFSKAFKGLYTMIVSPFGKAFREVGKMLQEAAKAGSFFAFLGPLGQGLQKAGDALDPNGSFSDGNGMDPGGDTSQSKSYGKMPKTNNGNINPNGTTITPKATGGDMFANHSYMLGDGGGPELVSGISGYVHTASATRRMGSGAGTVNITLNANGVDDPYQLVSRINGILKSKNLKPLGV